MPGRSPTAFITEQQRAAACDDAVLAESNALLAAPAWTFEAAAFKLVVLLSEQAPSPAAAETVPWTALRRLLVDLGALPRRPGVAS